MEDYWLVEYSIVKHAAAGSPDVYQQLHFNACEVQAAAAVHQNMPAAAGKSLNAESPMTRPGWGLA